MHRKTCRSPLLCCTLHCLNLCFALPLIFNQTNVDYDNARSFQNNNFVNSLKDVQFLINDLRVSGLSLMEGNETQNNNTHSSLTTMTRFSQLFINESEMSSEENPSPFYVNIGGQRFYGGIIEMNHALYPASVCRVLNACIRKDNVLVLPKWMRRHERMLANRCGQLEVEFSLPDDKPPPEPLQKDLLGLTQLRPSTSQFIADFLPNAVMLEFIRGVRDTNIACHSRKGQGCEEMEDFQTITNPVIQIHPRLRDIPEEKSWVKQFVKLMSLPNGQGIKYYFPGDHLSSEEDMTCFQSAMFTRKARNTEHVSSQLARDMFFFERNGIKKKSENIDDDIDYEQKCGVNITITNRLPSESSSIIRARYIPNIPMLRKAVRNMSRQFPNIDIHIATLTMEGKSLQWQINAMEKTDVWVAGHGPLLTDMIFLREKSFIVEIQPFSYYPPEYEKMAEQIANVRYARYIADPDLPAFRACVLHMYPKTHFLFKKSRQILESYRQAAIRYSESGNTHSLLLHVLEDAKFYDMKSCARIQRLRANPADLAKTILRLAQLHCESRGSQQKSDAS